jgi:hypothetical protein
MAADQVGRGEGDADAEAEPDGDGGLAALEELLESFRRDEVPEKDLPRFLWTIPSCYFLHNLEVSGSTDANSSVPRTNATRANRFRA